MAGKKPLHKLDWYQKPGGGLTCAECGVPAKWISEKGDWRCGDCLATMLLKGQPQRLTTVITFRDGTIEEFPSASAAAERLGVTQAYLATLKRRGGLPESFRDDIHMIAMSDATALLRPSDRT